MKHAIDKVAVWFFCNVLLAAAIYLGLCFINLELVAPDRTFRAAVAIVAGWTALLEFRDKADKK